MRRDLTINAMALAEDGSSSTLMAAAATRSQAAASHERCLCRGSGAHPSWRVSPRVSRAFRWRLTMALMTAMVEAGEVDALVAERVWQEFAKGLMARRPSHT